MSFLLGLDRRSIWTSLSDFWSRSLRAFRSVVLFLLPTSFGIGKEDEEKDVEAHLDEKPSSAEGEGTAAEPDEPAPADSGVHRCRMLTIRPEDDPIEMAEKNPGVILYVAKGRRVGHSGGALIELVPSGRVIKTPHPDPYRREEILRSMRVEAGIYQKIGPHPRLPQFFGFDPDTCCVSLEYVEKGNLKEYFTENPDTVTADLRLRWARQTAEAVSVLHAFDVIHCDLSPRNLLLDKALDLKLSDFGGSSDAGTNPSAVADTRFLRPGCLSRDLPAFSDDVFALGSLIYFIMTGQYPYHDITSDEVQKRFDESRFPDASHLPCGTIIERCWHDDELSAQETFELLQKYGSLRHPTRAEIQI